MRTPLQTSRTERCDQPIRGLRERTWPSNPGDVIELGLVSSHQATGGPGEGLKIDSRGLVGARTID
jgi:hypothetical protein